MKWNPTREAALAQLETFAPAAGKRYSSSRNYDDGPGRDNVSQLSPWLHAGVVSETEVLERVLAHHPARSAEKFISEVFWRIYFKGYLEQRPSIWRAYCEGRDMATTAMESNSGIRKAYSEAKSGNTGIEAFDYWAQELVDTGYLHNHARMWFASIWIFTLKLDWHLGADFFLRHLLDGDAASNTLSWRWVAGLHTMGKNYVASAENIARYTANHPHGPLAAKGLTIEPEALTEAEEHSRQKLELPTSVGREAFAQPFALLLHDEAASRISLHLPSAPTLVIGAARPEARSPLKVSDDAARFAKGAVGTGVDEAQASFGCPTQLWSPDADLSEILNDADIEHLAIPYLPTGWTRDTLWPQIAPLAEQGRVITLLSDLNRATWPHAKAGFFDVKKHMERAMREAGIAGA